MTISRNDDEGDNRGFCEVKYVGVVEDAVGNEEVDNAVELLHNFRRFLGAITLLQKKQRIQTKSEDCLHECINLLNETRVYKAVECLRVDERAPTEPICNLYVYKTMDKQ
jgi:hypothetical protein